MAAGPPDHVAVAILLARCMVLKLKMTREARMTATSRLLRLTLVIGSLFCPRWSVHGNINNAKVSLENSLPGRGVAVSVHVQSLCIVV
jgi:hypothetical protein